MYEDSVAIIRNRSGNVHYEQRGVSFQPGIRNVSIQCPWQPDSGQWNRSII